MAVTSTNALINVQDAQGAVQAPANGANAYVTPGALVTFSLVSTTGVNSWDLVFACPAYPALHGRTFNWKAGMVNQVQVQFPATQVSGANAMGGIQVTSNVSDGVQSIASATNFIQTRNWACVPMQHFARVVIPSALATYAIANGVITASATGAIGTQDGVTLVAGDLVLLPNGIAATATDAGVYQVVNPGATGVKFVLQVAPDWQIGAQVLPKTEIQVSEGTLYNGTTWVVTNTGLGNVVGTASFTFYPRSVIQKVTLAAGTVSVTNVPILAANQTGVFWTTILANVTANTVRYQAGAVSSGGSITTVGALSGNCSASITAVIGAGTISANDVSVGALTITNPV